MDDPEIRPPGFRLEDFSFQARRDRLSLAHTRALDQVLEDLHSGPKAPSGAPLRAWPEFLLPLAEAGLEAETMLRLAGSVPLDWPLDHSRIYYDFRLGRWGRHLEPPTFEECLEEYLEHSESPQQAIAFLRARWSAFLARHGF